MSRRSDVLAIQLPPQLTHAVDLEVLIPDTLDVNFELAIPLRALRNTRWIALARLVLVVRRRGDRQLRADRLDPA
jgi:hypothetical protein